MSTITQDHVAFESRAQAAPTRRGEDSLRRLVRWNGWDWGERASDRGRRQANVGTEPAERDLTVDDARAVQTLLMASIDSCIAWQGLADAASEDVMRARFVGFARTRDECAIELQRVLCESNYLEFEQGHTGERGQSSRRSARGGRSGTVMLELLIQAEQAEALLVRLSQSVLGQVAEPETKAIVSDQLRRSMCIHQELAQILAGGGREENGRPPTLEARAA